MNITEEMLDQLHQLQTKRLKDIADNGIDFDLLGSEHTIKGVYDSSKSTVTVPANAPVRAGITISSNKTGNLYIAATSQKAAITIADVLPILSEIEVMTTVNNNYKSAGTVPVVGYSADTITVPAHKTLSTGTVVKRDNQIMRVSGVRRDSAVTHLTLSPLPEQPTIKPKRAPMPELRQEIKTELWSIRGTK